MAKDEAIRNQKVFVALDSVLELQAELARREQNAPKPDATGYAADLNYRRGLAFAIRTLGLPVRGAERY